MLLLLPLWSQAPKLERDQAGWFSSHFLAFLDMRQHGKPRTHTTAHSGLPKNLLSIQQQRPFEGHLDPPTWPPARLCLLTVNCPPEQSPSTEHRARYLVQIVDGDEGLSLVAGWVAGTWQGREAGLQGEHGSS